MTDLEVGDLVLCKVDRIIGTIVFVKIKGQNKEVEGSIIFSEVAPGRIRNIREYVVPKKQIVCKVLRISNSGNIELSLRRVTQKERKEIFDQEKQEKSYKSILKTILKDKTEEAIKKIYEKENLVSFLEKSKEDSKELEKIIGKEKSKKVLDILNSQKKKLKKLKKEINLTTTKPNGISLVKEILSKIKNAKIKYISAGKYSLEIETEDLKNADKNLKQQIPEIEKFSKKKGVNFSIK